MKRKTWKGALRGEMSSAEWGKNFIIHPHNLHLSRRWCNFILLHQRAQLAELNDSYIHLNFISHSSSSVISKTSNLSLALFSRFGWKMSSVCCWHKRQASTWAPFFLLNEWARQEKYETWVRNSRRFYETIILNMKWEHSTLSHRKKNSSRWCAVVITIIINIITVRW